MKRTVMLIVLALLLAGCSGRSTEDEVKIIFLHHSTGKVIWDGGVKKWFRKYNRDSGKKYRISERAFPAERPYGWNNFPYDYWNIWVKNAGPETYMREPTLEILTKEYDVIVFKHCFPVSDIEADTGRPDISSSEKRLENYKLQYEALREKMLSFPETKFLVWTPAALVEQRTSPEKAARAARFARWVVEEWDVPGDNIFVWDFFGLETEGGLYLKTEYAKSETNSHPGAMFAEKAAPRLCRRIVDVIEGKGDL